MGKSLYPSDHKITSLQAQAYAARFLCHFQRKSGSTVANLVKERSFNFMHVNWTIVQAEPTRNVAGSFVRVSTGGLKDLPSFGAARLCTFVG
jgi:hypothetical protein